jgi:hypothetical protein
MSMALILSYGLLYQRNSVIKGGRVGSDCNPMDGGVEVNSLIVRTPALETGATIPLLLHFVLVIV